VALIVIVVSLIALWNTWDLDPMSGIFPKVSALLLLLLGIIYLITSFFKKAEHRAFEGVDKKIVLIMSAGIAGYVFLIWLIGFLIASLIFIGGFVWYLQGSKVNWKASLLRAGLSSVVVSVGFYLLFKGVFNVPLPNGLLF
jgi:hypothetical protein